MNKSLLALSLCLLPAAPAFAQPAPAAATAKLSADSTMGDLLANPAAKAVLEKHIPAVIASDQIAMASGMTLTQIAGFPQAGIDQAKLTAISADLAALK